ncbi:MAG: ribosomal-processing cysteine protease Prp [Mycoplasmataceae bacterium]|nr:ribosomal-processing cysteine protease Prp [Mycoplasmataceae bacterium]
MIKILIKKTNNNHIKEFTIKGHANSNTIKQDKFDLVCSAVSAVVYGILNSLDINKINVEISNGLVNIKIKEYSKENELILNVLKTSLQTIENKHKKYIFIKEEIL